MLEEISKKDFDKNKYVEMVINNEEIRDFVIENMINHPQIMKYYHCFYIIEEASSSKPDLFYTYWDDLYKLLNHPNSYHRDFGLILLAKLAKVDNENKFIDIIDDYMELLKDEKFMTAEFCVKNCAIIASVKEQLLERIINRLLILETDNPFPEKQKAVMMSFIIEGLELIVNRYPNKEKLLEFVKRQISSISPKTKKIAKKFLISYA